MQGKDRTRDAKLAVLARKQHGVAAYGQLIALGFTAGAIEYWTITGRLHRVYRGVYSVGYRAGTSEAWDMAAVLRCGLEAVLSHWSASVRWLLLSRRPALPHVSTQSDLDVKGIRTYRVRPLHPHDCTRRNGIPITTVPRTLLDLAGVADERTLRRAVNQAARSVWLNLNAVHQVLERNPRRKGSRQLRAVIASVNPATRRTRSDLEVAFLRLCNTYGIETPVTNGEINGIEVDFHWPGTNLIVELDSYEYHRTPQEFDNDRRKDARLKMAGYEVLRISDAWLDSDPAGVAEVVKRLMAYPG